MYYPAIKKIYIIAYLHSLNLFYKVFFYAILVSYLENQYYKKVQNLLNI